MEIVFFINSITEFLLKWQASPFNNVRMYFIFTFMWFFLNHRNYSHKNLKLTFKTIVIAFLCVTYPDVIIVS